jgi:hypothetical protein
MWKIKIRMVQKIHIQKKGTNPDSLFNIVVGQSLTTNYSVLFLFPTMNPQNRL